VGFADIWRLVQSAMEHHSNLARPDLDDIMRADKEAREFVRSALV
jgi:1-deoxy-D-xylulose 5-phosphate reductoisomerase